MAEAFFWGLLAASSLVIGALLAIWIKLPVRVIGLIMGFGAGALISAVAFDLVEEATSLVPATGWTVVGLFTGCAVFFVGDVLISRSGGGRRKAVERAQSGDSGLAIVLGTVLDGIPESIVIGLTLFQGGEIGLAYLAAVFISNLPESLSSTTGLIGAGWKRSRVLLMWGAIAVVSALASLAGYSLFQSAPPQTVAFVLTFAAGAILTMLADTMIPEAFKDGGKLVGIATTFGFAVAFGFHVLA